MNDNELISEFMTGYDFEHIEGGYPVGSFDNNWHYLMPVLKKINLKMHPDTYGAWRMINRPTEFTIKEVHSQVVKFIKEYN